MRRITVVAVSALLVLMTGRASAGADRSIVGLPAWDVVPSPGGGLSDVHAFSPTDVWAVGHTGDATLTEHWDGKRFSVVPSPGRPDRANVLEDVDGVAPADLWAVGHSDVKGFIGALTLAEHWDGQAWRIVPTPNVGGNAVHNRLTGVAAVASNDVWAMGSATDFRPGGVALTLHWDGTAWSRIANRCGYGLTEVAARASNDVWAVGGSDTCHWNGTRWTHAFAAPDPSGGIGSVNLQDVTVIGPAQAWAVGLVSYSCGEGQVCSSGEIQRWNGTRWQFVTHGLPPLYGVDAVAPDDVWAVGQGPAIVHYDGQGWSEVPTGAGQGELFATDASGANDVWAAGDRGGFDPGSLVEHAPSATSGAVVGGTNVSFATITWFGPETGSVETDPLGDYQVGGLVAGTYRFTATYAGCQPDSKRVTVLAGQTIGRDFQLTC